MSDILLRFKPFSFFLLDLRYVHVQCKPFQLYDDFFLFFHFFIFLSLSLSPHRPLEKSFLRGVFCLLSERNAGLLCTVVRVNGNDYFLLLALTGRCV